MRHIDTELLRSFATIVDFGGFTRAAHILGRTQSAVSMQIRRLEEITGCTLFDRQGNRFSLTVEGETLLGYARRMLALHDETLEALQGSGAGGTARLAVMDDYASVILPPILARFAEEHPHIHLEITTGFSHHLMKELGSSYDLVLATQKEGTGRGQVLRRERTCFAFSANHPLPDGPVLPLALLPPGNLYRQWGLEALAAAGRQWRVIFSTTSIGAVEAMAAEGLAITIVKEGTARPGLRLLGEADGLPALPESEIALYQAHAGGSPATLALARFLARALRRENRDQPPPPD